MNTPAISLLKITLSTCLLMSLPVIGFAAIHTPQKWKLDVPKTNVDFKVAYLGSGTVKGQFNKVNGAINYDVKNPTDTTINFTVNTNSIDAGGKLRNAFLRRKELLNTAQYPTMVFVSKKVNMINAKEANVTGDFTVLGQTKPLTVKVTLANVENDPVTRKPMLKFRATGLIDRYTYGVTAFPNIVGNMIPLDISGKLIAAS
ncbi:polyisoprenoid-binding protein [Psychrobacter frigidicola]|uniref:Polyisoprenoid-binding protein n=1 Tax=Psychrobacter frigidicola TaxID=45611 RepID=A0A5C7A404_9GAMM|nr:YceI family protein [Psychrobacter frigidicola]TXD98357.1 polyisoprenoid-binding protein [Psychrobacter frigidicola]